MIAPVSASGGRRDAGCHHAARQLRTAAAQLAASPNRCDIEARCSDGSRPPTATLCLRAIYPEGRQSIAAIGLDEFTDIGFDDLFTRGDEIQALVEARL